MEWIVGIESTPDVEDERKQRIRVVFDPIFEKIIFYGEVKLKNNKWVVFFEGFHGMKITLEELQEKMSFAVETVRKRLVEYENLDKGFSVLKWVAFEEEN